MASNKITEDPRIDPRIKAVFGALDLGSPLGDASSREQMLEEANAEGAIARRTMLSQFLNIY